MLIVQVVPVMPSPVTTAAQSDAVAGPPSSRRHVMSMSSASASTGSTPRSYVGAILTGPFSQLVTEFERTRWMPYRTAASAAAEALVRSSTTVE